MMLPNLTSTTSDNAENRIPTIQETYSLDQRIRGEMIGFLGSRRDMGKGLDIYKLISDAAKLSEFIMTGELRKSDVVSLTAVRDPILNEKAK